MTDCSRDATAAYGQFPNRLKELCVELGLDDPGSAKAKILAAIARDFVDAIRASVIIGWTQKESVRAGMRTKITKLLRKHGYPPDKGKAVVETVIERAESVCRDWAMAR